MRRALLSASALVAAFVGTAHAQPAGAPPPEAAPAPTEAAPAPAAAPAAPATGGFGQAGQIAIMTALDGSDLNINTDVSLIHQSQSMGGSSTTVYSLSPMAHYFVMPNLSVSAGIVIQHGSSPVSGSSSSVSATGLGILVGAGYNLQLAPMVSLWPQLRIGYVHTSVSGTGISGSESMVPLEILVPVLFHPADHFFVGLGPVFRTQLSNSASSGSTSVDQPKETDIGLTAVIGGYFGG